MNVVLGVVVIAAGAAVLLFASRMVRANEASSGVMFGRFDPYKKWPRFTRAWSLAITRVVGGLWVLLGLLAVIGVIDWV